MKLPVIIINLKAYPESIAQALYFAEAAQRVADETNVNIITAPPFTCLKEITSFTKAIAQSIDATEPGSHTGSVTAEEIKKAGAIGTLINHAEKRMPHDDINVCIKRCRSLGLISVVCAADENESKEMAKLKPDFVAIEPPELIGKASVMNVSPGVVKNVVDVVKSVSKDVNVICGAGIRSRYDVKKAIELGTSGVLLSSYIVKSHDVEGAMREIASGCG